MFKTTDAMGETFKRNTESLYQSPEKRADAIFEVGPEMTEAEKDQARRTWEAYNVHEQARGEKITTFAGRQYAPEPGVTMPSPEQVLLAQMMDIHPELGLWALERFRLGFDAVSVRNQLGALMNTLERD